MDEWDASAVFDEDYVYFYEPLLTAERSDREADVAWRMLDLKEGEEVLDCPCGHGRLANRLAARGARVTGLDSAPLFIELARADAAARGVGVEYVEGDMRALPWHDRFDALLCWFTSFGYFDDETSHRMLRGFHDALRPGGRVAIETLHQPALLPRLQHDNRIERDGNYMLDESRYDALTGRIETDRVVIRDGHARHATFSVRLLGFSELRDWLLAASFADVVGYGDIDEPLTIEHRRMIVAARKT